MEKLVGVVHRVTYRNADNGYCVIKVKVSVEAEKALFDRPKDKEQTFTVTGSLEMVRENDEVEFTGIWKTHPKHGEFLEVEKFEIKAPTSLEGLKNFLASPHFKGIGPALAEQMIDAFGQHLPNVIETDHKKLTKIKGLTQKKAEAVKAAWEKTKSMRREMIELQEFGLSSNLSQRIINTYQTDALKKLKENPYQLSQDIWGIGFTRADEVAQKMGFTLDNPHRIESGIEYVINLGLEDGHVYLPRPELEERAQRTLNVEATKISQYIDKLLKNNRLVNDPQVASDSIYLKSIHDQEVELAQKLADLSNIDEPSIFPDLSSNKLQEAINKIQQRRKIQLADEQNQALMMALQSPISVLTGGPGTGKSTIIGTLVDLLTEKGKIVGLTAPTGRAAKRMAELTGREAFTLHRLLKIRPGTSFSNAETLPFDLIVVDESSMLDLSLAYCLVKSVQLGTHILFVGDADQLPSVQAGNILADLIKSGRFPVTQLKKIFRQAEGSSIVENAHRIRDGVFPHLLPHPTDFYFFPIDDTKLAADQIVELVTRKLPQQFNLNPKRDIQVLAPLYKTPAGVAELNNRVQDELNPGRRGLNELRLGFQLFREGDRVMQLKNNYDKEVYNGEVGWIERINKGKKDQLAEIRLEDGRGVTYSEEEINQLTLAYAVSVHKSQGSEYPAIVMPVVTSHFIMLQRNLLYTGVTRGKKLVVLVGSKKALFIALKNDKPQLRYSGLKQMLGKKS